MNSHKATEAEGWLLQVNRIVCFLLSELLAMYNIFPRKLRHLMNYE